MNNRTEAERKTLATIGCPFCNGFGRVYFRRMSRVRSGYFAECLGCGVRQGKPSPSIADAVDAWNRRAPAAPVPQEWLAPCDHSIQTGTTGSFECSKCGLQFQASQPSDRFYRTSPQPPDEKGRKTVSILCGKQAVFAISILGSPMREFAPGKWENAVWPSDVASGPTQPPAAGTPDKP